MTHEHLVVATMASCVIFIFILHPLLCLIHPVFSAIVGFILAGINVLAAIRLYQQERAKMARKKKRTETIHVMSSLQATRAQMPKYYPACRCGKHRSKRDYNRKDKSWRNEEW